ncbi:cytochrome P450 [Actinoplanes sp. NPDC051513]|uniref:cytochrome P450 n=1 Tax=Actinoplanes sp. NPDC051513 TaxID=3363908 RepID=UPI00378E4BA8
MEISLGLGAAVLVAASLPYWLPRVVVALRMWLFARINGSAGITVPGELVDASQFLRVYSDPAASGRSRGAALSDLFWYWLSPGAEVHQEHLERGPRYDEVARCTRRILSMPSDQAERLAADCVRDALPDRTGLVRLRDLVMPVWAELYHRVVFDQPAGAEARRLIVDNADDVVTALKCCGLRHLDRRLRLTAHLDRVLDRVPHDLPALLDRREQVFYLQGTFFNTAVVQSSEATAHLMMVLAARAGGDLDEAFEETSRRFPLFGIAHRITTDAITLPTGPVIPSGSVLCFDYPEFHRSGGHIPFGVAANRPCPAWHLAPITVKAVAAELLDRFTFATSASHTRPLANRGPCLMTPRGARVPLRGSRLAWLRLRDRWEDVGRSVTQLVLGTYMVRDARRQRLCERYFERTGPAAGG